MKKKITAIAVAAAIVISMMPNTVYADDKAITFNETPVTDITLNTNTEMMMTGDVFQLSAEVFPENATNPQITWTSDNESAAVVNDNGVVTAVGVGSANITASAGDVFDICVVTVVDQLFTVTFNTQGGSEVPCIRLPEGSLIATPAKSVREGYSFEGWYKDQRCVEPWCFDTQTVREDTTLWALWKKDGTAFSGSGTEENPYRIMSGDDLAQLAALINAGESHYSDKYYIQTQDIDLSGFPNWTPIGTGEFPWKQFKGSYDGNNKKIENITVNIVDNTNTWVYAGLFGYVRGSIKNIYLENGNISATVSNSVNAGSIVGYLADGLIENCINNSNITIKSITENSSRVSVGGVIGCTGTKVQVVDNCNNYGNVRAYSESEAYGGGIIGIDDGNTNISYCVNAGNVYCQGKAIAGGILGLSNMYSLSATISLSFNKGKVSISTVQNTRAAGGIVGSAYSTKITDCFNAGSVSEENNGRNANIGGIAGYGADIGFNIKNCYNIGTLSGGAHCGGIAGMLDGTSAVSGSYYADTCPVGIGSGNGSTNKKTLDELRLKPTYAGFDFDSVWTIDAADVTRYEFAQLRQNLLYAKEYNVDLIADEHEGALEGAGRYVPFELVKINVSEKPQYVFKNWSVIEGNITLQNALERETSFIMPDTDVSVQAVFEKMQYNVTVESAGNGTANGGGSYPWGTIVPLTASANADFQFSHWEVISGEVDISDVYDMNARFAMPQSDAVIRAVFAANPSGYTYEVVSNSATITGYTGNDDTAVIPNRIGGYWVSAVGENAFSDKTKLTSIIIPDTVKSIGEGAFWGCTALRFISIGKQVQSIGEYAFGYCSSLTEIKVSSQNPYYKSRDNILYNETYTELISCPAGLQGELTVPAGVTHISDYAFYTCSKFTSVSIPDTVVDLGRHSFSGCLGLRSIDIPDSVTSIADYAFYGCRSLENIALSENTQRIGEWAFSSCHIEAVYFPDSLNTVGNNAFANNPDLTYSFFTGSMPEFGAGVFSGASNGFKVCYHVCEAEDWSQFYLYPKQAFCLLTKDFQNGQPEETNIIYLNSSLKLSQITNPVWKDHTFDGWYRDTDCVHTWDFDKDTVSEDITLYAKWKPGPYEIIVLTNNINYGCVIGGGIYEEGTALTLAAVPADGCRFVHWILDGKTLSESAQCSFVVNKSNVYKAEFDIIETPVIDSIDFIGNSSIRIEWANVEGAAGYEIWRSETQEGTYNRIASTKANFYIDSRLNINKTYYYSISAYCTAETVTTHGDRSDAESQKTAPDVPEAVAVSAGFDAISISWSKSAGASGYQIFRSTAKGGKYTLIYTTPQTRYTNTKLKTGATYYYKIRACDDTGPVTVSSDFSEAVFSNPVPKRITGLRCTVKSVTSVKLSWEKISGSSGYEIWRSLSADGDYRLIKKIRGTSCLFKSITPNTDYNYKVRAYRKVGKRIIPGEFSEAIEGKTVFASVAGSSASASSVNAVKISWKPVPGRKGYEIWRSDAEDGVYKYIATTTSTYYYNKSLIPNRTYYYKVRAYVMVGKTKYRSGFSNVTSAMPVFQTVSGASATMYTVSSNRITWNAVPGRKGYEIWRSDAEDGVYKYITTTTNTYYYNKSLIPNRTYYYKVRAYVMVGKTKYRSGFSNITSAMPMFQSVTGVAGTVSSPTSSRLTWNAVPGRSGYAILRSATADGTYKVIGTTTKTYYTDTKCLPNRTYYYKVRAYVTVSRVKRYSDASDSVSVTPIVNAVTGAAHTMSMATKVKLTWSAVTGRTKYEILRSDAQDGPYTLIGSTTYTYFYNSGLVPGQTYYYKIRAYKLINKVKYYGDESKTVIVAT